MNNKYKLLIKGFVLLGIIALLSTCGGKRRVLVTSV